MASSESTSKLDGVGGAAGEAGVKEDGRRGSEEGGSRHEEARTRSELEVKRSSGASVWSPPHLFHRHPHNQGQSHQSHGNQHQHQHHHLRMHLNPLQYLHHESRPRSMSDFRQPLSVTTTAPPSPANGELKHSPISRSSSKASSPTTFYQNTNQSTLYHPPHLHFTHQQPVKETHRLDLDFDPISGRKSINKYEIIDEIGRGTHGKVKLGRDLTSDEYVAIKIVERHSRPRLGKVRGEEDEKVRREIAILKKCRHPNVVRLIEVIDDPASKKVYLVLEYVELGEIVWRKLGPRDVLRRERKRLIKELEGEGANAQEEEEDSEEERIRRWKRRRRKQMRERRSSTGTSNVSTQADDANPNFWSLELGGLTEDEEEGTDDDYPSLDEESIVDAPHMPPLDSDSEEHSHHISSLSMVALGPNPSKDAPPYSFSHQDLQYVPALTFEQARSTFRDTLLGLEYLHFHRIIHRDIKPANLLWTKSYRVKISDFGVSYLGRGGRDDDEEDGEKKGSKKKDQASGRNEEVELAKTVGTPAFFAPELCFFDTSKPRPQITSAIDVWALGVTLYCLIFARCPFLADDEFELFNVIAKQELFIPRRRIRPLQGYSASVRSLSRPSTSNRPPSFHHQRMHSGVSAKTVPLYPRPASGSRGKPVNEDQESEIIPDDLRDLLLKLLTKDPTKRITIQDVKRHPWVLQGIPNPDAWIENTNPERLNGGGRIEVNEEEMEKAVVPASWTTGMIKQMKSGINRLRQKMGMGGSSSDGGSVRKEKVGLHPLASRGNDARGLHSFLGANRPGSSSSNSTLQEQGEALNRFSLSIQTGTPYNVPRLIVPPPVSASSLTRLLSNSPAKSISPSTNPNTPTKEGKSFTSPGKLHSPGHVKKFLNDSQISLANSLSRSLSRSSYNSERNHTSGTESTSPTTKKDRKDRIIPSSFLRRTRSTLTSGGNNVNDNNASIGVRGYKAVRRATSSNLGQEITNSPSPSSQSTIRRFPSSSSQESPNKNQIPEIRLATVPSREATSQIQFLPQPERKKNGEGSGGASQSESATTRSRRSSGSSNSTSMALAREGVAAALGEWFGKGKRLVRSFSRSRDTLASESEGVMSTSGGSGDDEGIHRGGLRISMLRKKRSNGIEASPVVSRVNAMGTVRSGNSTAAVSPIGDSGDGYFDMELASPTDGFLPLGTSTTTGSSLTTSTITTSNVNNTANATTAATSTSGSSNALQNCYSPDRVRLDDLERKDWAEGLMLLETSCPPSPDDYIMWDRQSKARARRDAARKEQEEEVARRLTESLRLVDNGVAGQRTDTPVISPVPLQPLWQPAQHKTSTAQPHSHNITSATDSLITSSSEEKMYSQRGHRHTDTTTSSLTESTSFPSIPSMMDSSAASSVSADAGWPSAKNVIRPATVIGGVNRDSGVYSLMNGNGSVAVVIEDDVTSLAPQHQPCSPIATNIAHLIPPLPAPTALNPAYHHSCIHSKSDEDDDGDDEALFLDLGTSNRRKSQNISEPLTRSKTIAVGVLQHQHHKRAVSSTSVRSRASETERDRGAVKDGGKERTRRRRSSKSGGATSSRGRSRSNTASSTVGTASATEGGPTQAKDKRTERREARHREKAEREREKAALPALPVPVTQ